MFDLPDDEILPLSQQHVFWTWSAQARVDPIPVKRAKGVYFWDVDEKRYLDFNSMTMCVNIGHGDERVIEAMVEQARALPYTAPGMTNKVRALASQLVAEVSPGGQLTKVLFTLGGADANENAIKLARGYTGRFKVLARYRSYHGATAGAMAATGDPRRTAWEPMLMPGVVHFLDPYRYRSTFHRSNPDISEEQFARDYLNHLEEIIQYEGPGTIAAILIESVTGTNGVIIPPEGYMQGVRALCDKYGIVMIADEVMSGFGRTGRWFAVDNWNVVPDVVTMAKGLTSGYAPLGAVAMKPQIAAHFDEVAFKSGLTYTSHPVSLAAAIANINVMKADGLVERAAALGAVLRRLLNDLGEAHPSVGEVRSIGLFGVIELVKDRKTKEPAAQEATQVMEAARKNGLLVGKGGLLGNTIRMAPPMNISKADVDEGIRLLDKSFSEVRI